MSFSFDAAVQRLAVQQLRDDVGLALVGSDVVYGDDVGMVERGGGPRFLRETAQTVEVVRDPRRQHLDRHFALEPRIPRAIHLAHPAAPDEGEDLVWTEVRADP